MISLVAICISNIVCSNQTLFSFCYACLSHFLHPLLLLLMPLSPKRFSLFKPCQSQKVPTHFFLIYPCYGVANMHVCVSAHYVLCTTDVPTISNNASFICSIGSFQSLGWSICVCTNCLSSTFVLCMQLGLCPGLFLAVLSTTIACAAIILFGASW